MLAQPWVFEPLVRLNSEGELVSVLADAAVFMSPRQLRFRLRAGVQFSDGSPVTFDDLAASLAQSGLRVAREGDQVVVESAEVTPIEYLLSHAFIFRRSGDRLLGTGPYTVAEQDSSHILLIRHRPRSGAISRVILQGYPRAQDAFGHTLKGDANLLIDVDPHWLEFFEGVPRLQIIRRPGTHANAVTMNFRRLSREERIGLAGLMASDEVRLAAFDHECVPPAVRPEIKPSLPEKRLSVLTVSIFERFALAVRRAVAERGGDIEIEEVPAFMARIRNGDFDLATARPLTWPPIVAALIWRTGASANITGYSNPEVDAAVDRRDWKAALRALSADPPIAIVCTPPYVIVVDSRIKAASFSTDALAEWEVAQ